MELIKSGFSSILKDNDNQYISFIVIAIKHSDPESIIKVDKSEDKLRITITPSEATFKQSIITDILGVHKLLHLKAIFSKSLALQKSISYIVEI